MEPQVRGPAFRLPKLMRLECLIGSSLFSNLKWTETPALQWLALCAFTDESRPFANRLQAVAAVTTLTYLRLDSLTYWQCELALPAGRYLRGLNHLIFDGMACTSVPAVLAEASSLFRLEFGDCRKLCVTAACLRLLSELLSLRFLRLNRSVKRDFTCWDSSSVANISTLTRQRPNLTLEFDYVATVTMLDVGPE